MKITLHVVVGLRNGIPTVLATSIAPPSNTANHGANSRTLKFNVDVDLTDKLMEDKISEALVDLTRIVNPGEQP